MGPCMFRPTLYCYLHSYSGYFELSSHYDCSSMDSFDCLETSQEFVSCDRFVVLVSEAQDI